MSLICKDLNFILNLMVLKGKVNPLHRNAGSHCSVCRIMNPAERNAQPDNCENFKIRTIGFNLALYGLIL